MIKRLLNYQRKIEILHHFFDRYGNYLKPGRYVIANEKLIYRNDLETRKFLPIIFGDKESYYFAQSNKNIKYFIKKLLHQKNLIIYDNNNRHGLEGTALYLQTGRKGIRLFDFQHKKVLSAYISTENFSKHIDDYFYFSRYFTIPPMLMYDTDEKTCIEKLIIPKPRSKWERCDEETIFDRVCDIYRHYYLTCVRDKKFSHSNADMMIQALQQESILAETSNLLKQLIPGALLNQNFPCVKQHGDLWSANLLFCPDSENMVFFIDWEHAGEYFFFFDLFKWMDLEAEKNHNNSYMNHYLTGGYDTYFRTIFEIWGMSFDQGHRQAYCLLYIVDYFYKRVLDKTDIRKRGMQEKYNTFITHFLSG